MIPKSDLTPWILTLPDSQTIEPFGPPKNPNIMESLFKRQSKTELNLQKKIAVTLELT